MAESKSVPPETEREQLQEDIERLQLVLQADDELQSEDSDDENALQIDTEYQDDGRDEQPGPSTSGTQYRKVLHDIDDTDEVEVIQLSEESELPVNPETTLALNRAYQELLLDSLRKIEVALAENRDKQSSLEAELEEQGGRKEKQDSGATRKSNINVYSVPYFKNAAGKFPPANIDVQMKNMMDEKKQDVKPPAPWHGYQRNLLLDAIKQDSLEQILRPMMNRKELEMEKLMGLQKEHQKEERLQCQKRIEEIDIEMEQAEHIPSDELLKHVDESKIDWLRISNMVFEGKREVMECQAMWKNALHPDINKEKWGKEEENKLMALAERYRMRNWATIAKRLGTNRTPFQCLQYFQQNLNDAYSKREWTEEEDALLAEVVESCKQGNRISWNQVSYYIEGRNSAQCSQRWGQIDPVIRRGKWKDFEDGALLAAVHLYGNKDWCKIQQHVPGRTAMQCRDRFVNALDPNLKPPSSWTYEEDKKLLLLVNKFGGALKCSWVKVANSLQGRTDNMVLNRFKRLMDWKKKSEWFETQTDEAKQSLGLVDIRSQRRRMAEHKYGKYEELSRNEAIAYRLAEFNSGVHREDYLKQLQDKMNGNLVVPRPPLLYRYNPRSVMKVWQKKEYLQKLIEAHVNQVLKDKNTKPQDLVRIPEATGELLRPLCKMSQRQKDKMENFLKNRQICDISVRELLEVTGKITKRGRAAITEKRLKHLKKDSDIEKKMRDIMKWKSYRSFTYRATRGRPKKYHIFRPKGKPEPSKEENNENEDEMMKVTSRLFLNALDVNGKQALQKSQTLSVDDRKDLVREIELLDNVFSGTASGGTHQTNSNKNVQLTSGNTSGMGSDTVTLPTNSGSDVNINVSANTGDISSTSAVGRTETSSKAPHVLSTEPVATSSCSEHSVTQTISTETINPESRIIRLEPGLKMNLSEDSSVPSQNQEQAKGKATHSQSQVQGQGQLTIQGKVQGQGQAVALTSQVGGQNVAPGQNQVLKQKQLPFLPPNVTSVHAFEALLMQRKLLIEKAGYNYNAPFYKRVVQDQALNSCPVIKQGNKVDLNIVMKDIDTNVGAYAVQGKKAADGKIKKVGAPKKKGTKGPDSNRDPLKHVRNSPDYALLKARFQAIFSWPSLLATIVPPDESELKFPEPSSSQEGTTNDQEDRISSQKKKNKFPCARSKHYYRWLLKGTAYRKERTQKIQEARKRNQQARLRGEVVKQKVYKKRRYEGEKRVSTRIRERKNVEEVVKQMTAKEENEKMLSKLNENKLYRKVTKRKSGVSLNTDKPVLNGHDKALENGTLPVVDDTVIEIISEPSNTDRSALDGYDCMLEKNSLPIGDNTVIEIVSEQPHIEGNCVAIVTNIEQNQNTSYFSTTSEGILNDQFNKIVENQHSEMEIDHVPTSDMNVQSNSVKNVSVDSSQNDLHVDGDQVYFALPVGHVDETTGTLKPTPSEDTAYPVALVVNQSVNYEVKNQ